MTKLTLTLTLLAAAVLLAGCEDSYRPMRASVLPPELSDCKFYRVQAEGSTITVVRCPNSSTVTSYQEGKTTKTAAVISD